jgi:predicted DNA-binding transcriptional regulator AlpA
VPDIATESNPLLSESLLSLQQVAKLVGIGERSIMSWVDQGRFPTPIRVGGPVRMSIRFKLADVQRFLAGQEGAAHA